MKVMYCPEQDVLRILFREAPIETVDRHGSGLIVDYDQHGRLVGLEVPEASQRMARPGHVEIAPMDPVREEQGNGGQRLGD